MRAGFEYFRSFERAALDFARTGNTRLSMPMLVLSGGKAGGTFRIEQARLVIEVRSGPTAHVEGPDLNERPLGYESLRVAGNGTSL